MIPGLFVLAGATGRRTLSASEAYRGRLKSFSPNARRYLLFVFLATLNAGIYGVIFNLYILRLGFHEDFLGLILAMTAVATGLGSLPAAFVCDRVGRKNTLLLSSGILVVALVFLYTITSEWLLIAASVAYGLSAAFYLVAGATFLVENSTSYERMHLFSVYYVIYTLAMLSGNLAGGALPDLLAGMFPSDPAGSLAYRLTLYLSLVAVVLSFLPLLAIREKSPGRAKTRPMAALGSAFQSGTIRRLIVFNCVFGLGWGLSLPYFNVYFSTVLGASTGEIGAIFSLSQIVMVIGYFSVPLFTERIGKARMASFVQALSIPFLLLFTVTSSVLVAAFGFIMRYLLMNMANPILNSFKLEIASKEQHAVVNSLTWTVCYTFVGIGTYAGGLLMAGGYDTMPFLLTCVLYGMSAILYYVLFNEIEWRQKIRRAA